MVTNKITRWYVQLEAGSRKPAGVTLEYRCMACGVEYIFPDAFTGLLQCDEHGTTNFVQHKHPFSYITPTSPRQLRKWWKARMRDRMASPRPQEASHGA